MGVMRVSCVFPELGSKGFTLSIRQLNYQHYSFVHKESFVELTAGDG